MSDDPWFIFSIDFAENLELPYQPSPLPTFKAEALFFLSHGGKNRLNDLLDLLDTEIAVLTDGNILKQGKIVVRDFHDPQDDDEEPVMYPFTKLDLGSYFSGFGALCEWLQKTCSLAFAGCWPQTEQSEPCCLNRSWMDDFSGDVSYQRNISLIRLLRSDLYRVVERATRCWNIDEYYELLSRRLDKAADDCDQKYAGTPILRDKNNGADRQKLFRELEREGIFDVSFYHWISDDECVPVVKKLYRPYISKVMALLRSPEIVGIRQLHELAVDEMHGVPAVSARQVILTMPQMQNTHVHSAQPETNGANAPGNFAEDNTLREFEPQSSVSKTQHDKNQNVRTILLMIALRYMKKGAAPTAGEIKKAPDKCKRIPEIFHFHLNQLSNSAISRAKNDLKDQGYQFDKPYQLKDGSYDRLKQFVIDNLDNFTKAFESKGDLENNKQ